MEIAFLPGPGPCGTATADAARMTHRHAATVRHPSGPAGQADGTTWVAPEPGTVPRVAP